MDLRHILDSPAGWLSGMTGFRRPGGEILQRIVEIVPLVEIAIAVRGTLVAHHAEQSPIEDTLADLGGEIPGIESNSAHSQVKARHDPI